MNAPTILSRLANAIGIKTIIPLGQSGDLAGYYGAASGFGVSREDGDNFKTNKVTLAEFSDTYAVGTAAALTLSAVWACVNLLSGTIASLPLMVYRDKAGKRVVAEDHPLYYLLHDSPNADQTAVDFWDFVAATIELRGNGYAEIKRNGGGRPFALGVPLPPELVEVKRLSSGSLEYRFTEGGSERVLPQERMLHIRGFGGNPLGGLSTLTFARRTMAGALVTESAARSTFGNGIRTNGAFISEHPLTKEQMNEVDETLNEKYAGAMNAGRPLILNHGMKYQAISMNPEDAQMLETRAFGVEDICRFFGVPPFMVGHTQKTTSWGTGLEQQTLGFQKFTLRRRLKRIEMALEKQLLSPVDRRSGVTIEFNLDGLLRGDSKSRAESYTAGIQNGYYTINEVRAWENLPPVEGGDEVRVQIQTNRLAAVQRRRPRRSKSRKGPTMKIRHNDFRFEVKAVDDAGTTGSIEGYASTFGGAPDAYGDIIAPGAFAESLAKHRREGTSPLMLWGHSSFEPPIGNWSEMAEDGKGLWVKGEIDLDDPLGARVYRALKRKAMKGLSIGYETKDSEPDPKRPGVRFLKAVDLWEVSPVNFPAQPRASVATVKSYLNEGSLPDLRQFEESLRELGFSKSQAVTIASKGLATLLRSESGADDAEQVAFMAALKG